MNEHIRLDIESNLLGLKKPLWKQIKNIAFTPEKDDKASNRSQDTESPL